MLVGVAPWQDYILGDAEPTLAGSVTIVPNTDFDDRWQRMAERMIARNGGRPCTYLPRTPSGAWLPISQSPVIVNLTAMRGEDGAGNVRIIGKTGLISAREWYVRRGFASRPQKGDEIETGQESFYVEDVDVVERISPDGVARDLKFRLALAGASHRRA